MTVEFETDAAGDHTERSSVRIDLPVETFSVAIARSVVRRSFQFLTPEAESSFLIALTEVVVNAIDEHRRLSLDDPVTVMLQLGDEPSVIVTDRGSGFDLKRTLATAERHTPGPESEAGRGLTIARAFVPRLSFETDQTGTTATLPTGGFAEPA